MVHKRRLNSNLKLCCPSSLQYQITYNAFAVVPPPLPVDAPPGLFAEGRALATTSYLADTIGHRQVGTPGDVKASKYLYSQAKRIAIDARQHRPDLQVIVEKEIIAGALSRQHAFGFEISNVYNGLTNIILHIAPKEVEGEGGGHKEENKKAFSPKSVLVNAHYDSTIGSPGASDAASCVGIALEMARTIVANSSLPLSSPMIFLFNGGEETLMQASHGFMASSPFAQELGAFINLESTGPWGPDVLFQHTGDWTLRAYARTAPAPRGTTLGQDFFELGLIPADTDYRMFSYRHYGAVPGIDVAFLFDGTAYHSSRDETARIRPGTLQAMGENMLATALEFSRVLKTGDYRGEKHVGSSSQVNGGAATQENDEENNEGVTTGNSKLSRGHVFFDILSTYMVVYSHRTASFVHQIPLIVLLTLSLQTAARKVSSTVNGTSGNGSGTAGDGEAIASAAPSQERSGGGGGGGERRHRRTISAFEMVLDEQERQQHQQLKSKIPPPGPLLRHACTFLFSITSAILLPAFIGGSRAVILQTPIFWYSNHDVAFAMYIPAAIAGLLIPYYVATSSSSEIAKGANTNHHDIINIDTSSTSELSKACARSLGCALLFSLFASALTAIGMHSAYLFVAWALGAILAALLTPAAVFNNSKLEGSHKDERGEESAETAYTWRHVFILLASFILPILVSLPTALSIATHVMEKIGLAGAPPGRFGAAVPDTAVGALTGVGLVVATGTLVPYITVAVGRKRVKMLITVLLGTSISVAILGSSIRGTGAGSTSTSSSTSLGRHIQNLFSSNTTITSIKSHPYSYRSPKRLIIQHFHRHTQQGAVYDSFFTFSSLDAVPVEVALPEEVLNLPYAPYSNADWVALYPLNYLVTGTARKAPPPPRGYKTPSLKVIDAEEYSSALRGSASGGVLGSVWNMVKKTFVAAAEVSTSKADIDGGATSINGEVFNKKLNTRRIYLQLDTVRSAWAVMNITGDLSAWSLGSEIAIANRKDISTTSGTSGRHIPEQHMVRYASGVGTHQYKFWLEPKEDEKKIKIELFVKHIEPSVPAQKILDSMAEWVSPAAVTTWHSTWEF
jgi:Peptidase family M28